MGGGKKLAELYFKNYRKFLILPFILLIIAAVLIFSQVNRTGDFISKDISLRGGVALTVLDNSPVNTDQIELAISEKLYPHEVSVRLVKSAGSQLGFLIESDIQDLDQSTLEEVLSIIILSP